jgi:alkylhydroperoxidase family enzyme
VAQITDDHAASSLSPRAKAALAFADAFLGADGVPSPEVQAQVLAEFDDGELTEMAIGLAFFHGVSKMLIALGCEPEQMDITELRTPGS